MSKLGGVRKKAEERQASGGDECQPSNLGLSITMDSLRHVVHSLEQYPGLADRLSLSQIYHFIRQLVLVKNHIILVQPASISPSSPPDYLPSSVIEFLAVSVELDPEAVVQCWDVFKHLAWDSGYMAVLEENPRDTSRCFGDSFGLRAFPLFHVLHNWLISLTAGTLLYLPCHFCTNINCKYQSTLKKAQQRQVLLFTLDQSVLSAKSVHLYCNSTSCCFIGLMSDLTQTSLSHKLSPRVLFE